MPAQNGPSQPITTDILARIAAELFNRSFRTRTYIDELGPGMLGEHAQLAGTLRKALTQKESDVVGHFELASKAREQNPEGKYHQVDVAIADELSRFARWFGILHELLVYLPRLSVTPETIDILERSCSILYREHEPSIILGSVFNAFEYDFLEIAERRLPEIRDIFGTRARNVVLQLSLCDRNSPLAAPILAHELGHAHDAQCGISKEVAKEVSGGETRLSVQLENWSREIFADLVAAMSLGPSPILALISMEYCVFFLGTIYNHNESHPSTLFHLRVVSNFLRDLYEGHDLLAEEVETYEKAWLLNIRWWNNDTNLQQAEINKHNEIAQRLLDPLVKPISDAVKKIPLSRHSIKADSIERSVGRLQSKYLISAQGKPKDELRAAIQEYKLLGLSPGNDREKAFRKLTNQFSEQPLDIPTILAAAHKYRLKHLSQLKFSALGSRSSVSDFCSSLQKLDELVGSSILITRVHREIMDRSHETI